MDNWIKKLIHTGINLIVAVIISFAISQYEQKTLSQTIEITIIRSWCDGFFVSAVLYLSIGGLSFIARSGGYDAFRYALKKLVDKLKHPVNYDVSQSESYYDFVNSRNRNNSKSYIYFLVSGVILLIVSIATSLYC